MNMTTTKTWDDLQIKDDYIFAKVMRDKEICKAVIEKLLNIKVKDLEYVEEQKEINIAFDSKSVRLDVYVEDSDRIFDIEMQTTNQRGLAKRSRYYQGMIDLNTIEKGENYKKLKDSYIIFICTFDPFRKGLAQYSFTNCCLEDNDLQLEDGTMKIFFNTKNYNQAKDAEIQAFLRYVNGEYSNDPFVKRLDARVKQVKENKEWRAEYMTLLMREQEIQEEAFEKGKAEGRAEGMAEGRAEGARENSISIAKNMIAANVEIDFIVKMTGLTKDEVEALLQEKAYIKP